MLLLLACYGLVAALLPTLSRYLGRSVFYVAALVPAAAFVFTLASTSTTAAGDSVVERVAWMPELGMALDFRLDTLSWVLSLVVTGVGALVLVYCARYFAEGEEHLGRFAGILLAFAGAMYGLIVADDVYLLFVFWEATSVFSYLLIGHYTGRKASRGAALQALLVTTLGGLVMLVGLVMLATITGTSSLSGIVAAAPSGPLVTTAIMLVLVGALSKSAIVPFHFWLPAAMAAPTPVSAYLHAAAMVKAGIYLVLRLSPGFAETPGWRWVLISFGIATMLIGAYRALRQHDLKLVLAYGTVSQLGFLLVIAGYGTHDSAQAAQALLLAHALYKATLFLVVGVIDHRAGTRDLRKLSGLGREAPVLAVITALAIASMVGLPPMLGFVAKEAVFTAFLTDAEAGSVAGLVALVGVIVGSVLTVAYSARFFWGAFARKATCEPVKPVHEGIGFLVAPAVLAIASLALGPLASFLDGAFAPFAEQLPLASGSATSTVAEAAHLEFWHGLEPALLFSAITLALGIGLFLVRERVSRLQESTPDFVSASDVYWGAMRTIDRGSARVTGFTQRGSLPFYLGVILAVLVLTVGTTIALNRSWPDAAVFQDHPAQIVVVAIMIAAAVAATRATKRFQAVVLVGVTGIGMSALFLLHGAPDLALTQILVEGVTLITFVLVLRRLPAQLGKQNASTHRALRAVIAISVGCTIAVVAVVALGARIATPISVEFPQLAYDGGHGSNVVNVTLVDIRGWDTMGELSVIIVAATGVASLIFINSRTDTLPRLGRREQRRTALDRLRSGQLAESESTRSSWLLAGRTLSDRNRSILLEVVVRLLFHALIIVSLYLLFAGHNLPGGGFAGGLVAGLALVARYLAGGRFELGAAAPFDAGKILGTGLVFAVGTALAPLFFGADALTSTFWEAEVPVLGHIEFVTSTFFDIGVYLVVIGLVLDVLRSLGAEVDRHQEQEQQGTMSREDEVIVR